MNRKRIHRKNPRIAAVLFIAAIGWVGVNNVAFAGPISSGFDLFHTPGGVCGTPAATCVDINGTAAGGVVELKGKSLLSALGDTDTIVQRTNPDPTVPDLPAGTDIPPGGLGTFHIELVALSLVSTSPVNTIPLGGPGLADLYVTINKLGIPGLPQPDPLGPSVGTLTITSHNDGLGINGGGTFDSFFDVFADLIFTTPGGNPNNPADRLFTSVFSDHFTQTGGTWSHTPRPDDPHNATFVAGNFYAGVNPQTLEKVLTPEQALLAAHGVLPGQVPEPSTLLLLGSGLAGIAVFGRKRLAKEG